MTDQNARNMFIAWLNNAHAMETQLLSVLQAHIGDNRYPPDAQLRFQQHLQETQNHANRIQQCVSLLGSSTSSVKSGLASIMGTVQAGTTSVFDDALTRNTLVDYASEQFEVAAYRALITAATEFGLAECVALLEQNLREDEEMALWLDQQLPAMVLHTMRQSALSR